MPERIRITAPSASPPLPPLGRKTLALSSTTPTSKDSRQPSRRSKAPRRATTKLSTESSWRTKEIDHPAGLGVGEAVADRLQEGDPDHRRGDEDDEARGDQPVDEDRARVGRSSPAPPRPPRRSRRVGAAPDRGRGPARAQGRTLRNRATVDPFRSKHLRRIQISGPAGSVRREAPERGYRACGGRPAALPPPPTHGLRSDRHVDAEGADQADRSGPEGSQVFGVLDRFHADQHGGKKAEAEKHPGRP